MTKERIEQIFDTFSEFNSWLNKLQEQERFCITSMMKDAVNEAIEEANDVLWRLDLDKWGVAYTSHEMLKLRVKDDDVQ